VFSVSGVQRSWDIAGGCATASVPIVLSDEDAERILLAKVEIFGATGLDWTGVVWRRPRYGAPLECAGQAIGLTHQRGAEFYGYGGFCADLMEFLGTNSDAFGTCNSNGVVTIWQKAGTTTTTGDYMGYRYFGDVELDRLKLTFRVNDSDNYGYFTISPLDVDGVVGAAVIYECAQGTHANHTATFPAGTYGFVISMNINVGWTASDARVWVDCYNLRLHSTALTTISAHTVIDHCIDKLPTYVLPAGAAYRAWIGAHATAIDALGFTNPQDDLKKRIDTVVATTDFHFGFYPRRVGYLKTGVPVFEQIPTTPTVLLDVRQAESDNLRDVSAADLASDYIVAYPDQDGHTRYSTVEDTDATHYLNVIGYDRTGYLSVPWTTSATTAGVAAGVAADEAERGAEGGMTITRARLMNGRDVPVTYVMPGMLARVRGMSPTRDLVVTNVAAVDSHVSTVTFGSPLDLQHLTARARRSTTRSSRGRSD